MTTIFPSEDRRIYVENGRHWMVLTVAELAQWRQEAPELIRIVNGEACSEVTVRKKNKVE